MKMNAPLFPHPDVFQVRAKPQLETGAYGKKRELDLSWQPMLSRHPPGYDNGTGLTRSISEMPEEYLERTAE
jgi:hypothetical protein